MVFPFGLLASSRSLHTLAEVKSRPTFNQHLTDKAGSAVLLDLGGLSQGLVLLDGTHITNYNLKVSVVSITELLAPGRFARVHIRFMCAHAFLRL